MTDLKTEIRAVLKAAMGDHDMAAQCVMNLIGQAPGLAARWAQEPELKRDVPSFIAYYEAIEKLTRALGYTLKDNPLVVMDSLTEQVKSGWTLAKADSALKPFAEAVHEFAQARNLPAGDDVILNLRGFSEDVAMGRVLVLGLDGYQSAVIGALPPETFMDELTAVNLTECMEAIEDFAKASIGPNEDPMENLARFTEWAKQGLLVVAKPGPPEIPRQALREFIEAQIDDEDRQMTAYAQIVTFIEQATAAPAVARVERPQVEAQDFGAFDGPITVPDCYDTENSTITIRAEDRYPFGRVSVVTQPLRRSDEAD